MRRPAPPRRDETTSRMRARRRPDGRSGWDRPLTRPERPDAAPRPEGLAPGAPRAPATSRIPPSSATAPPNAAPGENQAAHPPKRRLRRFDPDLRARKVRSSASSARPGGSRGRVLRQDRDPENGLAALRRAAGRGRVVETRCRILRATSTRTGSSGGQHTGTKQWSEADGPRLRDGSRSSAKAPPFAQRARRRCRPRRKAPPAAAAHCRSRSPGRTGGPPDPGTRPRRR